MKSPGRYEGRGHAILVFGSGEVILILIYGAQVILLDAQLVEHKLEGHGAVGNLGLGAYGDVCADVAFVGLDGFPAAYRRRAIRYL